MNLLFLVLAGGVALAPGAVAGLLTARGRRDRAFAALVGAFSVAVMVEAAVYAANGSDRFKERYLFVLLPLLPIAFGLYVKRGRPARRLVTVLAIGIVAGAALVPLSGYVKGDGFDDSPLLWAFIELQRQLGSTGASLVVRGLHDRRGESRGRGDVDPLHQAGVRLAPWFSSVSLSVGASRFDRGASRPGSSSSSSAPKPSWVDATGVGPVTAIETRSCPCKRAPRAALLEPARSSTSSCSGRIPAATDPFTAGLATIAPDGGLIAAPGEAAARPAQAPPLRNRVPLPGLRGHRTIRRSEARWQRTRRSRLWRPTGKPRLSTYELGRYWDGWLGPQGGLEVWPGGARAGTVSFTLSLPERPARPGHDSLRRPGLPSRAGAAPRRAHPGQRPAGLVDALRRRPPGPARWRIERVVSVRSTTPLFTPA